jgi:hypothetical protein
MNASVVPARAEFFFRKPDNMILVENAGGEVTIRAAQDNFSARRKALFIRELAIEGFIPDHFQWFTDSDLTGLFGIKWIIDSSWCRVSPMQQKRSRGWLIRMYVWGSLSWLSVMGIVLKLAHAHLAFK